MKITGPTLRRTFGTRSSIQLAADAGTRLSGGEGADHPSLGLSLSLGVVSLFLLSLDLSPSLLFSYSSYTLFSLSLVIATDDGSCNVNRNIWQSFLCLIGTVFSITKILNIFNLSICTCDVSPNYHKKNISFSKISAWAVLSSVLNFLANFSQACL